MANKRFKAALEQVDREKLYEIGEALELLRSLPAPKFDESVDIALKLGVDPRHSEQMVRGAIVLPHGTGSDIRVLVFARGEKEEEAREAGADYVGGDDLAKKIQDEGWLDFERVIATPDMMSVVGRLGRAEDQIGAPGLAPPVVQASEGAPGFDSRQAPRALENHGVHRAARKTDQIAADTLPHGGAEDRCIRLRPTRDLGHHRPAAGASRRPDPARRAGARSQRPRNPAHP